jgi:phosphohistidine swiveling domain-containing protein
MKKMKTKIKREVMVSHQSDLLTQDLILTGVFKYCKFSDFGLNFDFPLIRYEHGNGDISYPEWQVKKLKKLKLSDKDLIKLVKFLEKELLEYEHFLNKFKKDIKSNKNGLNKIKTYFEKSEKGASTIPYFAFEMSLYPRLKKEDISPKDIPSSLTETSLASLKLEEIYLKHKKEIEALKQQPKALSTSLNLKLHNFCERFGYLGMIYFKGNPWTISETYRMLLNITSEEKTLKKQKGELPKIVEIISALLRLRTRKWELMCYGAYLFRKFMKRFYSNVVVYEDLLGLRINEVIDIVAGKYQTEDIGQKRKSFELEITTEEVLLSSGEKKVKKITSDNNIKEIRGVIAQPGKVVGRAKIVLTPKEGYKVEKGDVLVTKMSTPDFLPIMKKASAFVTDIGGITSHAAIVSREMRKPCIIGAKIATQVLKDGMLIEVDADNGIVKIL